MHFGGPLKRKLSDKKKCFFFLVIILDDIIQQTLAYVLQSEKSVTILGEKKLEESYKGIFFSFNDLASTSSASALVVAVFMKLEF